MLVAVLLIKFVKVFCTMKEKIFYRVLLVGSMICSYNTWTQDDIHEAVTQQEEQPREDVQSSQQQLADIMQEEPVAPVADSVMPSGFVSIDRVRAVCYLDEGKRVVVTQFDVDRPRVDGTRTSLQDLCVEPYLCQEAKKVNIEQDPETVTRYFDQVCRENNLDREMLATILRNAGYTYQEAFEQIGTLMMINSLLGFKFGAGRVTITEEAIRTYYDEHPEYKPHRAIVERVFIPFETADTDAQAHELVEHNSPGLVKNTFSITETETENEFFFSAPIDHWSSIYKRDNGFELFRVLERKQNELVPFEQRRNEIGNMLYREKYMQEIENYKKQLLASATIVYFP